MTMLLNALTMVVMMFMMMKHPLSLVLLLIMLTLLTVAFFLISLNISWLSMILFLVFLGGLLIIFTYLSALVPNEIYYMSLGWLLIMMSPFFSNNFMKLSFSNEQYPHIMKMTLMNETSTILMFMIYLLITLITTMLMAQQLKSPLNQNNY